MTYGSLRGVHPGARGRPRCFRERTFQSSQARESRLPSRHGKAQPWFETRDRVWLRVLEPRRDHARAASRGECVRGSKVQPGSQRQPQSTSSREKPPAMQEADPHGHPESIRMMHQLGGEAASDRKPGSRGLNHKGNLLAHITEKSKNCSSFG